jgi:hypothetical protein
MKPCDTGVICPHSKSSKSEVVVWCVYSLRGVVKACGGDANERAAYLGRQGQLCGTSMPSLTIFAAGARLGTCRLSASCVRQHMLLNVSACQWQT